MPTLTPRERLLERIRAQNRAAAAAEKEVAGAASSAPLLTKFGREDPAPANPIFSGKGPDAQSYLFSRLIHDKEKQAEYLRRATDGPDPVKKTAFRGAQPDDISPVSIAPREIRETTGVRRGLDNVAKAADGIPYGQGLKALPALYTAAKGVTNFGVSQIAPAIDFLTEPIKRTKERPFDFGAAGLAGKMGYNLENPVQAGDDAGQAGIAAQLANKDRGQTPGEAVARAGMMGGLALFGPAMAEFGHIPGAALVMGGQAALEPADNFQDRLGNIVTGAQTGIAITAVFGSVGGALAELGSKELPHTAELLARSVEKRARRRKAAAFGWPTTTADGNGYQDLGITRRAALGLEPKKITGPGLRARMGRGAPVEDAAFTGEAANSRARDKARQVGGENPSGRSETLRPVSASPAPTLPPVESLTAPTPPSGETNTAISSPSTSQTPTIRSRAANASLESATETPGKGEGTLHTNNVTSTPSGFQPKRFKREDFPLEGTPAGEERLAIRDKYVKENGVAPYDRKKDQVANFTNDPEVLLPAVRAAHAPFIDRLRNEYGKLVGDFKIVDPGVKPDASVVDKVHRKHGRFDVLGDLSRASMIVDKPSSVHAMIEQMNKDGLLAHVDDFMARPDGFGYGGIHLQLHDPATGIMHELQIHTPQTWRARSQLGGHDLYDRYSKNEGKLFETEADFEQANREIEASRRMYNYAHAGNLGGKSQVYSHELHYDPGAKDWYVTKKNYYTRPSAEKVVERGLGDDYSLALKHFADKYEPGIKGLSGPEATREVGPRIKGIDGIRDEVIVHDKTVKIRYRVVEAADLIPSNNPANGFARDPRYPAVIQGRSYHGKVGQAARENVLKSAGEANPRRLQDLGAGIGGPPVITTDGIVDIGNQRAMMKQIIAAADDERYPGYLEELKSRSSRVGIDPESYADMHRPVLVREIADPSFDQGSAEQLRELNQLSDIPPGKAKDPLSEGFSRSIQMKSATNSLEHLSKTLGPDETIRDYLSGPGGVELFKRMVQDKVILQQEMGRYVGARGVTDEGKSAIEGILQSAAIGNLDVIANAPPKYLRKLEHSFAPIVTAGNRSGWALEDQLQGALDLLTAVEKNRSKNVADLLGQNDAFGRGWDKEAIALAEFIEKKKGADIATAAREYSAAAEASAKAGEADDLFGAKPETAPGAFDRIFGGGEAEAPLSERYSRSTQMRNRGGFIGSIRDPDPAHTLKMTGMVAGSGVGGAAGGAIGGQIGSTPEERRKNASLGVALGATIGGGAPFLGGRAAKFIEGASRAPGAEGAIPSILSNLAHNAAAPDAVKLLATGALGARPFLAAGGLEFVAASARESAGAQASRLSNAAKKALAGPVSHNLPEAAEHFSVKVSKDKVWVRIKGAPSIDQLNEILTHVRENPKAKLSYSFRDKAGRPLSSGSSVANLWADIPWAGSDSPHPIGGRLGAIGSQPAPWSEEWRAQNKATIDRLQQWDKEWRADDPEQYARHKADNAKQDALEEARFPRDQRESADKTLEKADLSPDGWVRAYHGSRKAGIDRFRSREEEVGPHFGTPAQAEQFMKHGGGGSMYAVELNIKTPLRVIDDASTKDATFGETWRPSQVAEYLPGKVYRSIIGQITDLEGRGRFNEARKVFIRAAREQGYDGIAYANKTEGPGDSWIPFSPKQVRNRLTGRQGRIGAIGSQPDMFGHTEATPAQGGLFGDDAGKASDAPKPGKAFTQVQEEARLNAEFLRKQFNRMPEGKARQKVAAMLADLDRVAGFDKKITAPELSTRAAAAEAPPAIKALLPDEEYNRSMAGKGPKKGETFRTSDGRIATVKKVVTWNNEVSGRKWTENGYELEIKDPYGLPGTPSGRAKKITDSFFELEKRGWKPATNRAGAEKAGGYVIRTSDGRYVADDGKGWSTQTGDPARARQYPSREAAAADAGKKDTVEPADGGPDSVWKDTPAAEDPFETTDKLPGQTFKEYHARLEANRNAREAAIKEHIGPFKGPVAFDGSSTHKGKTYEQYFVLSKSANQPGMLQLSRFDANFAETPMAAGHDTFNNMEEAVREIASKRARPTTELGGNMKEPGGWLRNRTGAIGSQPDRGAYLGDTDLLNVSKIVESSTARERIADAAEKYRTTRDGNKQTWAQADPLVKAAVDEIMAHDPKARLPHVQRKLTGIQLLARRDVIRQNDQLIETLSKKISGRLTVAEREHASQLLTKAVEHNDALLSDFITGASQKGRDLNLLKRMSNKSLDHDVWQIQAKRMLGPDRPLDDATAAQLRKLVNEARAACE